MTISILKVLISKPIKDAIAMLRPVANLRKNDQIWLVAYDSAQISIQMVNDIFHKTHTLGLETYLAGRNTVSADLYISCHKEASIRLQF